MFIAHFLTYIFILFVASLIAYQLIEAKREKNK